MLSREMAFRNAAQRTTALAQWAVAHAEQGEAVAVELEVPARPLLARLLDEGALRRVLLFLERDGKHARIAARPRRSGGEPTITELFEEDHRRLDEIAAEMRQVVRREPVRAIVLCNLLASGLRRHVRIEETLVFPMHEASSRYAATSAVMREEHRAVLAYVERLEREADLLRMTARRDLATTRLLSAEAGLAAVLAEHNRKEEQRLFPLLDHTMSAAARLPILRRIVVF